MKTLARVKKEYPDYSTLITSCVRRIGMDSVMDVVNHGADAGYSGFTYYTDTVKFWRRHRKDIMSLAENMADDMGENVLEMVGAFNCLKYYDHRQQRWTDREGQKAVAETIYGRKTDDLVANAMAWFALEEVCRMFDE